MSMFNQHHTNSDFNSNNFAMQFNKALDLEDDSPAQQEFNF